MAVILWMSVMERVWVGTVGDGYGELLGGMRQNECMGRTSVTDVMMAASWLVEGAWMDGWTSW